MAATIAMINDQIESAISPMSSTGMGGSPISPISPINSLSDGGSPGLSNDGDSTTMGQSDSNPGSVSGGSSLGSEESETGNGGAQKCCLVCGDRASGYHFDSLTCESCKAFFRRNAFRQSNLKCLNSDNQCVINRDTRRFCASCRLTKCFNIGMKKENILSDEARAQRRSVTKRPSSGMIGGGRCYSSAPYGYSNMNCYGGPHCRCRPRPTKCCSYSPYYYHHNHHHHHHHPPPPPPPQTYYSSHHQYNQGMHLYQPGMNQHYQHPKSNPHLNYSMMHRAERLPTPNVSPLLPFEPIFSHNFYKSIGYRWKYLWERYPYHGCPNLTAEEINRIDSLVIAHRAAEPLYSPDIPMNTIFSLLEHMIRCLVRMCKRIPEYRALSIEDQTLLFKEAHVEIFLLWSVMTLNAETGVWEHIDEMRPANLPPDPFPVNIDFLKATNPNVYYAHVAFVKSFRPEWRKNIKIMTLLIVIVLFSPEDPSKLFDRETVEERRIGFLILLKRYLISIYGSESGGGANNHSQCQCGGRNGNPVGLGNDQASRDSLGMMAGNSDGSHSPLSETSQEQRPSVKAMPRSNMPWDAYEAPVCMGSSPPSSTNQLHGEFVFNTLLDRLTAMRSLHCGHVKLFLDAGPAVIGPLLSELLDVPVPCHMASSDSASTGSD